MTIPKHVRIEPADIAWNLYSIICDRCNEHDWNNREFDGDGRADLIEWMAKHQHGGDLADTP
jgi:hypothetical protein